MNENVLCEERDSSKKYYSSFWVFSILAWISALVPVVILAVSWFDEISIMFGIILASMVFGIFYVYFYFLPYLVANKKNHTQKRAIYILNVLLGWTFLGWIISLIWACTEPKENNKIVQVVKNDNAEEIRKYKDLLDSGIITQEEFDSKKTQLLNL